MYPFEEEEDDRPEWEIPEEQETDSDPILEKISSPAKFVFICLLLLLAGSLLLALIRGLAS